MPRTIERVREVRRENRQWSIELLGGVCVRCGENNGLHFDHINRNTKSYDIAVYLACSQTKLRKELKKCQLLCRYCHIKKTCEDNGFNPEPVHGTIGMYSNHGCRCLSCKRANALNQMNYYVKYGRKKYGKRAVA